MIRTCLGCRDRVDPVDLLRVVAQDGRLVPDPARRLPGRGAWVHPTPACVGAAGRRWARALRLAGPLDDGAIRALVTAAV